MLRGEPRENLREHPALLRDRGVTPEPSRRVVLALAVSAQVDGVLRRVRGCEKLHDSLRQVRPHAVRQHALAVVYELDVRQVVLAAVLLQGDVQFPVVVDALFPLHRRGFAIDASKPPEQNTTSIQLPIRELKINLPFPDVAVELLLQDVIH